MALSQSELTRLLQSLHSTEGLELVRSVAERMLQELIEAEAASRERRTYELPLVVMNACGSGRMRAPGSTSFPYLFLGNRNRGFIGAETEIPDDIAAAFSRALYERFLILCIPLGRAVLESRLHLLRNPLGLTYAAYADLVVRGGHRADRRRGALGSPVFAPRGTARGRVAVGPFNRPMEDQTWSASM
ncbi:hypothetical protein [Streptomyces acidiscabies]|uniref:Uncharacterized protein n=1 Tax=Streptomyces acidiscabies TaxID=42234 RepID=A0ABU4M4E0_9ACTN|nr:hypothetical protein [Streptomyces acidiscabies]MDX3022916.1 hypothetical protein [Streptomyces acidiscabies]